MIRRPPRSTLSSSSAASDVYKRQLHDHPVLVVLLVAEHVHEGTVVDPVHAQGPHEVALEQPERLGQQERAGRLDGNSIDHLAPELMRHQRLERPPAHAPSGSRRDLSLIHISEPTRRTPISY